MHGSFFVVLGRLLEDREVGIRNVLEVAGVNRVEEV
jgi:hypothetical protein